MAKIKLTKSAVDAAQPQAQAVINRNIIPLLGRKKVQDAKRPDIAGLMEKLSYKQTEANKSTRLISDEEMSKLFRQLHQIEAKGLESYIIPLGIRLQFEFGAAAAGLGNVAKTGAQAVGQKPTPSGASSRGVRSRRQGVGDGADHQRRSCQRNVVQRALDRAAFCQRRASRHRTLERRDFHRPANRVSL